ncbi:predicted protein [Naegleria gruberi]|uniref:Predicted protein n=1 Tax=Naegleria gruberi TaxID=5762 RepID=D2V1Y4_NAEGR|nr:uncharacterized protein NAEGRDRAFT_62738 [Naegleria gruberi]EFC49393.1 predicted protein [Naegleria gruberi]|eukprot:XP_002682137.1 predicted protein [Naegleria gruberi strain NEG-M]
MVMKVFMMGISFHLCQHVKCIILILKVNGDAGSAQFDHPKGCAVHPNKIVSYPDISDNNVIRRISNTFRMSTIVGTTTCFGLSSLDNTVCGGHGKCIDVDTCQCNSGWKGNKDCSQFSCDSPSNHASKCIGPNQYECQTGWKLV